MLFDLLFKGMLDLPGWGVVVAMLGLTHITIAGVTIFLHRHQAHRALDLHPLPAHFFRFWLWLTTGMVTREWTAVHRKHHAKCETPEDPHSPQVHGLNRVLWGGVGLYRREAVNPETLARYGHGTPDDWLERHLYTPRNFWGIFLMLGIDAALFGLLPGLAVWLAQMVWIPFWAAGVVNGVGHFWGYRNFNCTDASTNLLPWGLIIGGEELHNNHHAYATSAKLSNRWYEFDIGWLYIRLMAFCRLARVKKIAPTPRLAAKPRAVIDGETLQALITHRYDLLARYARSLQQVFAQELRGLGRRERRQLGGLRPWLAVEANRVPGELKARLDGLLAGNGALNTLYQMRGELVSLWEKTTASREQLVAQLEAWCHRAESSGIRQLEELALRLRRYAC